MKTKNTKTAAEIKEVRDFLRERTLDEKSHYYRAAIVDCLWEVMMNIETYESCGVSAETVISLLKESITFDVDFYYNLEREDMKNG